jgi:hypothetical protein
MTKLTPQVSASIVRAVAAGVPVVAAAALVGIAKSTVLQWLQRGAGCSTRRSQPIYVAFVDAIARAQAIDEARRIARLDQAGRGGQVLHEKVTTYADGRQVVERHYAPPEWRADAFYLGPPVAGGQFLAVGDRRRGAGTFQRPVGFFGESEKFRALGCPLSG